MNEEVVKQVLKSAQKIFVKNKVLMNEHCRIIRVSIKDLEVLKINADILPSVAILARAIVTMEMVFEMNQMPSEAKDCSFLTKHLVKSLEGKKEENADKILVKCKFCGDYFEYSYKRPWKKFCAWTDGEKQCYKKYHAKEYYERKKKEKKCMKSKDMF